MTISYDDPFHFLANELMKRRRRNLDEKPELGPITPVPNPADPFPPPPKWPPAPPDDSRKLPAPGPPPPFPPKLPSPGPGVFPDPGPSPTLQYPQEPPPIYVDPPGDNIGNAPRNYPFVVVGNPPTQAGAAPAGGLLGLLQAVMQQRNAGPYADPKISPNGAPATRPDGSSPAPFFRSPALPPQDLYEADEARQAREAAAAQLGRGVRRLARRNTT